MATVKRTFDPKNPPQLSEEEKALYDAKTDAEIDYSDNPELDSQFFEKAWKPSEIPTKEKVSVRLDSDVLEWLRSYGRGYQTRMNSILRDAMKHTTN